MSRRCINIDNDKINSILDNSKNTSQLIEEALIFFLWAVEHRVLSDSELNRLFKTKLLQIKKP